MKSTESDVCYFEVDAVFDREPVELLEESTWTAGLRRTGNNTGEEVLGFLEFEDVFLSGLVGGRKPPCQNQRDSSSRFDTIPASDGQTDKRMDTYTHRQHTPR